MEWNGQGVAAPPHRIPEPDPPWAGLDVALQRRLARLFDEGWAMWDRFDAEVRLREFHPFVHGDYALILAALVEQSGVGHGELRETRGEGGGDGRGKGLGKRSGEGLGTGRRFLEWGSATGVVTIMADLLGFDAYGIELDAGLVKLARGLAARHGSGARFFTGSFLPSGYRWGPRDGDGRIGTIGEGRSAYPQLGIPLDDFEVVYAYPWPGEEAMMMDLMRRYGDPGARLLLYRGGADVPVFHGGRPAA